MPDFPDGLKYIPNREIRNPLIEPKQTVQIREGKNLSRYKEDKQEFRLLLSKSIQGKEKMHARFIFTSQCGASVPAGFDCRTHPHANCTDWSLLD